MILDVTFRYNAKVLAPRQRNPRDARYVHTISVDIPEFAAREMPVALRFKERRIGGGTVDALQGLRWDGESLYKGVIPENSMADLRHATWLRDCAEHGHEREYNDGNPFNTSTTNWSDFEEVDGRNVLRSVRIEDDKGVAKVVKSDRDEVEAKVRAAAAGIVLVDDLVHVRCREPVYTIAQSGLFAREHYKFAWPELYEPGKSGHPSGVFRADEVDYMIERQRLGNVPDEYRIEILIPEAVRHDAPERLLLDAATELRGWYAERIAKADEGFFRDYRILRDEIDAFVEARRAAGAGENGLESVQVDPSGLVAVLRETVDGLSDESAKEGVRRVEAAFDRIDARTLSAEIGAPSP